MKKGVETNGLEIRSLFWKEWKGRKEKPPPVLNFCAKRGKNRHERWNETKTGVGSGKDVMVLDGSKCCWYFVIFCLVSMGEKSEQVYTNS